MAKLPSNFFDSYEPLSLKPTEPQLISAPLVLSRYFEDIAILIQPDNAECLLQEVLYGHYQAQGRLPDKAFLILYSQEVIAGRVRSQVYNSLRRACLFGTQVSWTTEQDDPWQPDEMAAAFWCKPPSYPPDQDDALIDKLAAISSTVAQPDYGSQGGLFEPADHQLILKLFHVDLLKPTSN